MASAAHRQDRRWRHWPWGWWALATSIAAWACLAVMAVLFSASIGMPGDGDHAMQATRLPLRITAIMATTAAIGSLVTGSAALRLGRQPGAAIAALILLLILLLLSGVSLLGLMA